MGPTWGQSGADRTQVRPMLSPWALLSGTVKVKPAIDNKDQVLHRLQAKERQTETATYFNRMVDHAGIGVDKLPFCSYHEKFFEHLPYPWSLSMKIIWQLNDKSISILHVYFVYYPLKSSAVSITTLLWRDISVMHYSDAIMSAMASQITGVSVVYTSLRSGTDQRKHQSSASLAFERIIHRRPVYSPQTEPVRRENVSIWWRHNGFLKALATRLFVHHSAQVKNKENIKFMHYWPFVGWIHRWFFSRTGP